MTSSECVPSLQLPDFSFLRCGAPEMGLSNLPFLFHYGVWWPSGLLKALKMRSFCGNTRAYCCYLTIAFAPSGVTQAQCLLTQGRSPPAGFRFMDRAWALTPCGWRHLHSPISRVSPLPAHGWLSPLQSGEIMGLALANEMTEVHFQAEWKTHVRFTSLSPLLPVVTMAKALC